MAFVLARVNPGERATLIDQLTERCDAELSRYKRPVEITVADTLPLGPTGKVRRSLLQVLAGEAGEPSTVALDPLSLPLHAAKPRTSA